MSKGLDMPPTEYFEKVGLTVGVFDYLHPGHIMMFQECHKQCDYLIVGINDATNLDAWKQKPIQLLKERVMMVEALEVVDETFVYSGEKELYKLLQTLSYHIRFVGEDHKASPLTGEDIPDHLDKVIYIPRNHGFSSTVMKYRAYWKAIQDKDSNTFYSPEGYEWSDIVSGNLFPKN